jgi:hypothetical protein
MSKKIISDKLDPEDVYIDPVTFHLKKNDKKESVYLTKPVIKRKIDDPYNVEYKNIVNAKESQGYRKLNKQEVEDFYLTPEIEFGTSSVLSRLDIYDFEDLKKWVKKEIPKDNNNFIIRILDYWIEENILNLDKNSKGLIDLFKKVLVLKYPKLKNSIEKDIKKFWDYWITKIKPEDFDINFEMDFKNYLKQKYNETRNT